MTSRRASRRDGHRPRRPRREPHSAWPVPGPVGWVSTVAGWCSGEEHLDEAKQGTHDTLIRLMGESRTGGVLWQIYRDVGDANRLLDVMGEGADQAALDHYRRLRGFMREWGGILVVAIAPGTRPL